MAHLPSYPLFRPLEIDDKPLFDSAFGAYPPEISEYTFTNLYAWRETYRFEISSRDGFIVLVSRSQALPRFFDPIGAGDRRALIRRLLEDSGGQCIRLPETTKRLFDGDVRFRAEPDRDNADYVFSTRELIELKGRRYDGKRNLIRRFNREQAHEYVTLGSERLPEAFSFERAWCSARECGEDEGLGRESTAFREMLVHYGRFRLRGGAILRGGETAAVAVGEPLNPSTFVMHILKSRPGITGLSQAMYNAFLRHEAVDFERVNMEQDLGLEGLRKAKLSYHPVALIDKYSLQLR